VLRQFLGRCDFATSLKNKPWAGYVIFLYTECLPRIRIGQVRDLCAINVIFAQGQRQHPVGESLCAFG